MAYELDGFDPRSDFEDVFALVREIVSLPPFEEARREVSQYPRKETVSLVARAEGRIVGFCAASHPYWNAVAIVDYLVVSPKHRRRGLGARMVRAVEARLRELGMRRVCVQTISWNVDAVRFYEREGFARIAGLGAYCDDEHSMVWLDKRLGEPPGAGAASAGEGFRPAPAAPHHILTILAVTDLVRSAAFYRAAFGWPARVDVPVYVEFALPDGRGLGLYSREAFARNTGQEPAPTAPGDLTGTEIYLHTVEPRDAVMRLEAAGARRLSALAPRGWGDEAAYYADPDGNVVVVARPLPPRGEKD